MSDALFSLRNVSLPARRGRESADVATDAGSNRNLGTHVPRSPVTRLNSVTLNIPHGSTAVVGLSGAGKTSLLNVLSGFETTFSGEFKSNVPVDKSKRLPLYWVPQNGGLWPHLTGVQHLEVVGDEGTENARSGSNPGQVAKRTDEFLGLFDLNHRRQALPAELSQGERSRLALARALATRAKVLLLDEPLSHVDPVRKPGYWKIVRQIAAGENMSMIFTSHEPETVLRQAEHVICLDAGAVTFEGPVRALYDTPPNALIGEFLGPLNWFSADEVDVFLNGGAEGAIRPERLRLSVADSSLELVSTPFIGAYCESVVRHVESGRMKSVLHQPDVLPSIGARVELRRAGALK